jgi:hypothetical protein
MFPEIKNRTKCSLTNTHKKLHLVGHRKISMEITVCEKLLALGALENNRELWSQRS